MTEGEQFLMRAVIEQRNGAMDAHAQVLAQLNVAMAENARKDEQIKALQEAQGDANG